MTLACGKRCLTPLARNRLWTAKSAQLSKDRGAIIRRNRATRKAKRSERLLFSVNAGRAPRLVVLIAGDHAARDQEIDDPFRELVGGGCRRIQHEFGISRRLVRRIDARKRRQQAAACLGVKTLRVPRLANRKRG